VLVEPDELLPLDEEELTSQTSTPYAQPYFVPTLFLQVKPD